MSGHGSSDPVPAGLDLPAALASVARRRAAAQRLGTTGHASVALAASAMLGKQAQDFAGGLLALGLRSRGARESDVLAALERREVVRTWPARGTLMFVAAVDPPDRGDLRLLPPFDELLLGYADRSASLDPSDLARLVPTANGLFRPAVTVDGRVVGTWRRTLTGGAVAVEVDCWVPLGVRTRRRLDRRVAEYADFVGRDLAPTARPTPTTRRDDRPR